MIIYRGLQVRVSNTTKIKIVKNMRLLIKEDVGWCRRASFAGKSFDSAHLIRSKTFFKSFPVIKYSYSLL